MDSPDILILDDFLSPANADHYLHVLLEAIPWQQEQLSMFGRLIQVPRLTAWYGDAGTRYRYSGVTHVANGWTPALQTLREATETSAETRFNSVLLNRYRNGNDSVSWHADAEAELGPEPIIASLSLGATRRLQFRRKKTSAPSDPQTAVDRPPLRLPSNTIQYDLRHGSLLIMRGNTQREWEHQIPKTKRPVKDRINLTFRKISSRNSVST